MKIIKIYTHFWEHFLDFKYSENRIHFFVPVIINALLLLIVGALTNSDVEDFDFSDILGSNEMTLTIFVVFLMAEFTSQARRLHDINLNNWFSLLVFVPFVGWLVLLILNMLPGNSKSRWPRI